MEESTDPKPQLEHHPAPLTSWPGAFGAFNPSRAAIRRNLNTVVLLLVLSLAVGVVIGLIFGRVLWLSDLVSTLIGSVFTGAQIFAYMASVRGRNIELSEAFNEALPLFFKLFLLNLIVAASVVIGLLLLIVPGLIILPRLVLAPYFLLDKKLGVIEAYQASWQATKGHSRQIWGIIGVFFLMILPSITIIGIIATVYLVVMYSAATALLYQYLLDTKPKSPAGHHPAAG